MASARSQPEMVASQDSRVAPGRMALEHVSEANAAPAAITSESLLPANLLSGDEIVILLLKPSLWFVVFRSARWVAAMVVLVACVGWWGGFVPELKSRAVVNIAMAIAAARVGFSMLQWAARYYVLTNRRVLRIRGVFNVDLFECQLTKVQNTYLTLTWYERLFGLGTISFATAGTAGAEPAWINVNRPLEVHEHVRAAIHKAQRPGANGI